MKHIIAFLTIAILSMGSMLAMSHESSYNCGLMVTNTPKGLSQVAMKLEGEHAFSEAQKKQIQAIGMASGPKVHELVDQIEKLDKAILHAVIKEGKSVKAVASELDELSLLRRQATEMKLEAMHKLRQEMSSAQYQALLKASGWKE